MTNRLHHEQIFRGKETMSRLANLDVLICGGGAIGSNLAVTLARVGFEKLAVVDRDRVEERNLGTQVFSLDDVGGLKAEILRNLIYRDVGLEIEAVSQDLNEKNIKKLIKRPDLVVDAFDNSVARGLLTQYCLDNDIACLHVGVNDQYAEVRWNEHYKVPSDAGDDICDYPLARTLITLVVSVGAEVIIRFSTNGEKQNYCVTLSDLKITPEEF